MLEAILFYGFSSVAVIAAILVVSVRNPVHSAVCLVVALIAVAGIFLNLGAEFLTVVQILVYVGGIMVLFIFVVMLVSVERLQKQPMAGRNWKTAVVLGVVLAAEMGVLFTRGMAALQTRGTPTPEGLSGNTQQLGWAIYMKYMLPFEVASVLLLVAIIGAIVFTRKSEAD
jgi:NADH-quinone oxidoreductase subunit J